MILCNKLCFCLRYKENYDVMKHNYRVYIMIYIDLVKAVKNVKYDISFVYLFAVFVNTNRIRKFNDFWIYACTLALCNYFLLNIAFW